MDCLRGYESASSSDSDTSGPAATGVPPSRRSALRLFPARDPPSQPAAGAVGRKILGLASVLPPHIVAALMTRAAHPANRRSGTDNTNDDDDEDDEETDRPRIPPDTPDGTPRPASTTVPTLAVDGGIASFLQALNRTAPVHAQTNSNSKSSKQGPTNSLPPSAAAAAMEQNQEEKSRKEEQPAANRSSSSSTPMGASLLHTTSTTTSLATNLRHPAAVRDIHGSLTNDTTTNNNNNGTNEGNALEPISCSSSSSILPAARDNNPNGQAGEVSKTRSKIFVCAAPRIPATTTQKKSYIHGNNNNHNNTITPPDAALDDDPHQLAHHHHQQQQHEKASVLPLPSTTTATTAVAAATAVPKKSRKEMERALRRGDIQSVWNDANVQVQGVDPQSHAPVSSTTAASMDTTAPVLRNVMTHMYDPSTGTTVGGASGIKGGGKNQINQLLAQAAHFERERAQQQHDNPQQSVAKLQRANAKRKYGW